MSHWSYAWVTVLMTRIHNLQLCSNIFSFHLLSQQHMLHFWFDLWHPRCIPWIVTFTTCRRGRSSLSTCISFAQLCNYQQNIARCHSSLSCLLQCMSWVDVSILVCSPKCSSWRGTFQVYQNGFDIYPKSMGGGIFQSYPKNWYRILGAGLQELSWAIIRYNNDYSLQDRLRWR